MSADSKKALLDRLSVSLSVFSDYVSIQNGAFLFDSNQLGELLMCDLLSELGPWGKLCVLQEEVVNHPAIDLMDEQRRVGIQVTSTRTITKVKDTINGYLKLEQPPEALYILMVCGRQDSYKDDAIQSAIGNSGLRFDPEEHIIDLGHLLRMATRRDATRIGRAARRLEQELGRRARDLLERIDVSANRVLRVLTSHQVPVVSFGTLLKLSSDVDRRHVATARRLKDLLTEPACQDIAAEFNVSPHWLAGRDDRVVPPHAQPGWRTEGAVSSLLETLVTRHRHVAFHFVVADDMRHPFPNDPGKPVEEPEGASQEGPVLLYYEAAGKHADKVFGHLGIQPWEMKAHRVAALFFDAVLRDLSLRGIASVSVRWWQWPRDRIHGTVKDTLLAEAVGMAGHRMIDATSDIVLGRRFRFVGQEGIEDEFNDVYAPIVRDAVTRSLERARTDLYATVLFNDLRRKHSLPEVAAGCARLYGNEAMRVAADLSCQVRYANGQGDTSTLNVDEAKARIREGSDVDEFGEPSHQVYLDVKAVDPVPMSDQSAQRSESRGAPSS